MKNVALTASRRTACARSASGGVAAILGLMVACTASSPAVTDGGTAGGGAGATGSSRGTGGTLPSTGGAGGIATCAEPLMATSTGGAGPEASCLARALNGVAPVVREAAATTSCHDLVNDGGQATFACPQGDDPLVACGGCLKDGTYDLVKDVIWASGCGIFLDMPTKGVLRIGGDRMDIVRGLPGSSSSGSESRVSYVFTASGGALWVRKVCDDSGAFFDPSLLTPLYYGVSGDELHLADGIFRRRNAP